MPKGKGKSSGGRKPRKTTKATAPRVDPSVLSYARLLADPCEAPLARAHYGATGSGYLAKFSTSINITTTSSHGCIIWFPDYIHTGNYTSCIGYVTDDASTAPTEPVGSGSAIGDVTGTSYDDPAGEWVTNSACEDARTISACMRLMYTGTKDAQSGKLGVVTGLTKEMVCADLDDFVTVNELMRKAKSSRFADDVEVKWRPSESSENFRAEHHSEHAGIYIGASPTRTIFGDQCQGMAIVWQNCVSGTSLSLELHKAIEWRPKLSSRMNSTVPRAVGQVNVADKALALLDSTLPGWQKESVDVLKRTASAGVKAIFSQKVLPYLADVGMGMLM